MNAGTHRKTIELGGSPYRDVRIVRRTDGKHIRLTNGRRNRIVGKYASTKMGATSPWESRSELHDFYRSEVDTDVVAYVAQPETLHWRSKGQVYRYTPDRLDELAGGQRRIVEVKDSFEADRDPAYAEKLRQAAEIYKLLGCDFQIRERPEITAEPEFPAIEVIQAYRRSVVTVQDIRLIQVRLVDGPVTLAAAATSLGHLRAEPVLFAMMVQRVVSIDVSAGLHQGAEVTWMGSPVQ